MFSQRSVTEYPTEAMDWVTSLDGGESLRDCYQCGKCVPVCPVNHVGDYGPRKLHVEGHPRQQPRRRPGPLAVHDLRQLPIGSAPRRSTRSGSCRRSGSRPFSTATSPPSSRRPSGTSRSRATRTATRPASGPTGSPTPASRCPSSRRSAARSTCSGTSRTTPRTTPAARTRPRAMARILTALGVDFAILGNEERSDADSARLAGETGLFEMLAEQNIKTFRSTSSSASSSWTRTPTTPSENSTGLGWEGEVLHYTQFLAPLVDRIEFRSSVDARRDLPRPVLPGPEQRRVRRAAAAARRDPRRAASPRCRTTRANGYCCGGGGGGMWLDGFVADHVSERLSERRVREAVATVGTDGGRRPVGRLPVRAVTLRGRRQVHRQRREARRPRHRRAHRPGDAAGGGLTGGDRASHPRRLREEDRMDHRSARSRSPISPRSSRCDADGTGLDREWLSFVASEWDEYASRRPSCSGTRATGARSPAWPSASRPARSTSSSRPASPGRGSGHQGRVVRAGTRLPRAAAAFAGALAHIHYDLVLTGVQAIDDLDGQVGPLLATASTCPTCRS